MNPVRRPEPAPPLRALQQWLSFVMRHPATAEVALRAGPARRQFAVARVLAGAIVAPNARMTVTERLQVYNGSYLARLQEVLATDYGALRYLLGDDAFHALCARYVARHPSRHPNLNRYGKLLPAFVRAQRALPHRAFAAELSQLECHVSDAFDAPASTQLAAAELTAIDPQRLERARLVTDPSLRLAAFRFPVNAFYVDHAEGRAPTPPAPRRSHVAVYRRDHRVFRMALEPRAFAVLDGLHRGEPLGRALVHAKGGDVGTWFRTWAAEGLFTAVRIAAPRRRR